LRREVYDISATNTNEASPQTDEMYFHRA